LQLISNKNICWATWAENLKQMSKLEEKEEEQQNGSEVNQKKDEVAEVASTDMQQTQQMQQKVPNARKSKGKKVSATRLRPINEVIKTAKLLPVMKPLLGTLWQEGEIAILAGDTGVGKSIFAVNIARSISSGTAISPLLPTTLHKGKILYYDFELSDRQLGKRFKIAEFPDNLIRVDMNPECPECLFDFSSISENVESTGAGIIIVDNISALSLKTTVDPEAAINIMRHLKRLQTDKGLSILVLAHIPKIAAYMPLTINHIAGSKAISNFIDSAFFIARSTQGKNIRYIKEVKNRSEEQMEGVISGQILDKSGFLTFEVTGKDEEMNHLTNIQNSEQLMEIAIKLHNEGKTLEEIGQAVGKDKSTISRWLKAGK
jgi:predicted ATP-dependent serine protease